jgi:hypothetical protein
LEQITADIANASHELKSANALNRAFSVLKDVKNKPSTLLLATIDYKGFRIIAYADPSIDGEVFLNFSWLRSKSI